MLDYALVHAVAAVVRTGSFEKAAQALGVTASAISQRVKLLEDRLGTVLIVRGQPCTATETGRRLCRHAEEVALLEHGLRTELGPRMMEGRWPTLRIAVNADSLATWFVEAMSTVDGLLFDIVLDDQDHSAGWLRRGEVSAAVSASAAPVQGCDLRPLGAMRYIATASPAYQRRWFPDGLDAAALQHAPCLTFNSKDRLQSTWAASVAGKPVALPTHWLPSSTAFVEAALTGLGWGLNPEALVADALRAGRLVALAPERPLDVPLYWHWSRTVGPALAPLTEAVVSTGRRHLIAPGSP